MAQTEPSPGKLVDDAVHECMEFINRHVEPDAGFNSFAAVAFYTKLIEALELERDEVEGASEHD